MSVRENGKKFRDDSTIHIINKCISLKDEDVRKSNEILKEVLENVIETMKKSDEFFRDQFQNLVFVGSYYKGTKVGKPEEFDVNFVIKLPINYQSIQLKRGMPGFAKVKLNKTDPPTPKWEKHKKILAKWVTAEGFLNQDEFRNSMESLLMRSMPREILQNGMRTIKIQKSGPAFTFVITQPSAVLASTLEMNVDLVPVLEFSQNPPLPENLSGANWYAVAKPIKCGQDTHLNWRMSFWHREKKLLSTYSHLKPLIRQMKKLRDTQGWKIIPSYHIETLFMHHTNEMKKNAELQKLSGTKLFIHMLLRLKEVCETQNLPNFWDHTHNLIDAEKSQLASIVGRLGKIIKQITDDPVKMADCVLSPEELKIYEEELKSIRQTPDSVQQPSPLSFLFDLARNLPQPEAYEPRTREANQTNNNNGFMEIINELRLLRNDIAQLTLSVDVLSRRVTNVERILSHSSNSQEQPNVDPTSATSSLFDLFHGVANNLITSSRNN